MKSQDIRQSFLDFFAGRDHRQVASGPLVPHGDPTLLFTNAGMVPFKDSFLGVEEPVHPRAVSVQKCLRVSGKHNDLENVGPSPRHHTFFEMMGNFSFGDYFKEEAIRMAWELVTEGWGLPTSRLFATVFEEDDEARELWRRCSTLPEERILRCGAADNFWAMGETGPCGPSSEIFVDLTPEAPQVPWQEGSDSGRYLEIWNLVFMQFDRDTGGELRPLPNPSIDTGSGLERVAAVLQGVASNYDTDLFQPLLQAAAGLASVEYGRDPRVDVSLRVIGDHLRAVSFLLVDGVIPGPDGRGYVLRRLLRRALRHGMRIGFEEPFLHRLVPVLDEAMAGHYPELGQTAAATTATIREEEEKYLATRAQGARRVQEVIDRVRREGGGELPAEEVFRLYDTYGLELAAIHEIAEEEQLGVDGEGFEKLLEERRETSRDATGEHQKRMASLRQALQEGGETAETRFEGYENLRWEGAKVQRLASTAGEIAQSVEALSEGQKGVVVLDRTVFYAESGGQVGDTGRLSWSGGRARVLDTRKDTSGTYLHFVTVEAGRLRAGDTVDLEVDGERRRAIERHHTATHLLHAALHEVLGSGARQAGSLVAPDRLRFDFTHNKPLTVAQLEEIEDRINHWIRQAIAVEIDWKGYDEAIGAGAMALFGEKYGDRVRTVSLAQTSHELCGGCHVRNSGEIGLVLLSSERGVASGVRRIEALSGAHALAQVRRRRHQLEEVEGELGAPAERAAEEVAALKGKLKELEGELSRLRMEQVVGGGSDDGETTVAGVPLIAREVPPAPAQELRGMADTLRDRLGSGVVVLATRGDAKVSLVVTVSPDLIDRVRAGQLVKELAPIVGGGGGGRPNFAQAGGRLPEKLPELLAAVPGVVAPYLEAGSNSEKA